MALPATSTTPPTPLHPHLQSQWLADHSQPNHCNSPHGQKRRADEVEDLEDRSSAISTNFKRLRINNAALPSRQPQPSSLHQPQPQRPPLESHASLPSHPAYQAPSIQSLEPPSPHHQQNLHPHTPPIDTHLHPLHARLSPNREYTHTPPPQPYLQPPSCSSTCTNLSDEPMTLDGPSITYQDPHDSSKDKIVINDLDAELAEIEAAEAAEKSHEQDQTIFLPENYEKEISGVPVQVLRNMSTTKLNISQALIPYKDPSSISIPEENDSVRKAVIEARKRMRDRQNHGFPETFDQAVNADDHVMDDLRTPLAVPQSPPRSHSRSHSPSHETSLGTEFKNNIRKGFAIPSLPTSRTISASISSSTPNSNTSTHPNTHKRLPSAQLHADSHQRRLFDYGFPQHAHTHAPLSNLNVKQPTPSGRYIPIDLEDEHADSYTTGRGDGDGHTTIMNEAVNGIANGIANGVANGVANGYDGYGYEPGYVHGDGYGSIQPGVNTNPNPNPNWHLHSDKSNSNPNSNPNPSSNSNANMNSNDSDHDMMDIE